MSPRAPAKLPRGRPRSFDTEAVIERAMDVFWSRRNHATARPDLLRTTKLSRGSLSAAFGDKHSVFLRALDRYAANALTRTDIEVAPRREPADSLRACLAGYVDRASGASGRRGCPLVATPMDGVEPSSVARLLVCLIEGLRVVGKPAATAITSQATIDVLLDRFIG
jgi:TetR/AcrR family transcriptional regulator, transcriptional repressor for nem operon